MFLFEIIYFKYCVKYLQVQYNLYFICIIIGEQIILSGVFGYIDFYFECYFAVQHHISNLQLAFSPELIIVYTNLKL